MAGLKILAGNPPIEAPKPVGTGTKGSNFKPNFDSENKLPYNARNMESLLNKCGDISNSTIPKSNMPNVKFAGKCIEKELICSSTGKPLNVKIVFDQRGFPIFDKYAKFETSISGKLSLMDRSAHMRAVTRNLRQNIESGIVNKNIFTERQLQQIYQGVEKIEGYTWHYHQDYGRMQLVSEEIHKLIKYVGDYSIWGK